MFFFKNICFIAFHYFRGHYTGIRAFLSKHAEILDKQIFIFKENFHNSVNIFNSLKYVFFPEMSTLWQMLKFWSQI